MRSETSRELVRREAAENGWKLRTFLESQDEFSRRGTVVKIWWTDRDTAIVAARNKHRVAYASKAEQSAPRMAIVQTRQWLSEPTTGDNDV